MAIFLPQKLEIRARKIKAITVPIKYITAVNDNCPFVKFNNSV